MMAARGYKTKKELKAAQGTVFRYTETSMFGAEYRPNSTMAVVGPSPYERKWYAQVTVDGDGRIVKVS